MPAEAEPPNWEIILYFFCLSLTKAEVDVEIHNWKDLKNVIKSSKDSGSVCCKLEIEILSWGNRPLMMLTKNALKQNVKEQSQARLQAKVRAGVTN